MGCRLRKIKTAEEGRKMKTRKANIFEFRESNLSCLSFLSMAGHRVYIEKYNNPRISTFLSLEK